MKDTSLNKWTVIILVILIAAIIGFYWFKNKEVADTLLSVIFGFLFTSLINTFTMSQRRQWDLDDIARDKTSKYYESKLSEMSLFILNELEKLSVLKWQPETRRIPDSDWKITREWLISSASIRTFSQVVGDTEIVEAYNKTRERRSNFNDFIKNFNSGKFDTLDEDKARKMMQDEMTKYMDVLKDFELAIEITRLKVLRGELSLTKKSV